MKRILLYIVAIFLTLLSTLSKAQTAMQLSGLDCNNVNHDLFAELDAGKAVVVYFFMDNCNVCPPPATNIQKMVNNILVNYPGMVTAYALPYNNVPTCAQTAAWVTSNSLYLYAPYDSGAVQVAHYGGFGMPTVVLLGGSDHRTLFKTKAYLDSDTTIMRDSILALFAAGPSSLTNYLNANDISIFPNPSSNATGISVSLLKTTNLSMELCDINGKTIETICQIQNASGCIVQQLSTAAYTSGHYLIKINTNGKIYFRKLEISH
nr:T9SS type A sorting domain-containing protein [Chitinophagaceae bacterium]